MQHPIRPDRERRLYRTPRLPLERLCEGREEARDRCAFSSRVSNWIERYVAYDTLAVFVAICPIYSIEQYALYVDNYFEVRTVRSPPGTELNLNMEEMKAKRI